jgi:hypothetical protein
MTYAEQTATSGQRDDEHMTYEMYQFSQYSDGSVLDCQTMITYSAVEVVNRLPELFLRAFLSEHVRRADSKLVKAILGGLIRNASVGKRYGKRVWRRCARAATATTATTAARNCSTRSMPWHMQRIAPRGSTTTGTTNVTRLIPGNDPMPGQARQDSGAGARSHAPETKMSKLLLIKLLADGEGRKPLRPAKAISG